MVNESPARNWGADIDVEIGRKVLARGDCFIRWRSEIFPGFPVEAKDLMRLEQMIGAVVPPADGENVHIGAVVIVVEQRNGRAGP
jgi:hypothetical protein